MARNVGELCAFPGCPDVADSRGFCMGHYMQWYKGKPMKPKRNYRVSKIDDKGRVCVSCGLYKTNEHFYKYSNRNRTPRSRCKDCYKKEGK